MSPVRGDDSAIRLTVRRVWAEYEKSKKARPLYYQELSEGRR